MNRSITTFMYGVIRSYQVLAMRADFDKARDDLLAWTGAVRHSTTYEQIHLSSLLSRVRGILAVSISTDQPVIHAAKQIVQFYADRCTTWNGYE